MTRKVVAGRDNHSADDVRPERERRGHSTDAELETVLKAHGDQLLKYVTRLLPADVRKWHDPLDVVQDVFLQAFCNADDFPVSDRAAALRWLKTVARHRIVDLGRQCLSRKRGGAVAVGPPRHGSVVALLEELAVYSRTPSKSAAAHEFLRLLEKALSQLQSDYALAIRLRYIQGLSCKEAGAQMGCTDRAVEALCRRGLEALRLELPSGTVFL